MIGIHQVMAPGVLSYVTVVWLTFIKNSKHHTVAAQTSTSICAVSYILLRVQKLIDDFQPTNQNKPLSKFINFQFSIKWVFYIVCMIYLKSDCKL